MKKLILTLLCSISITSIYSQCTTATYGQWPTTTYTPAADDSWEYITTAAYSGEYSVVAVTSGQHYQFLTYRSTNGAARYLTITDELDNPIVAGTTTSAFADTIGWTATFTGNIKFFTHTNSGCGTSTQSSTRAIRGVVPPPPPPSNDDPSGAIQLFVNDAGGYRTYSNAGSTNTLTESTPSCASYNGEDVWFYVDVPAGISVLDIDTQTGDITDGGMTIYRGTIGSLTEIECDDDDGLDGLMPWIYREDFTPGERIYIRVWEYGGGTTGTFNIFVSTPQALPVELVSFEGQTHPNYTLVEWETASEQNSDYFLLDRSEDGEVWRTIENKKAAGNSTEKIKYTYVDRNLSSIVYYRLIQVDINGDSKTYGPIVVKRNSESKRVVKCINVAGQEIDPSTAKGVIIEIYEDGTTRKMIK